MTGKTPVNLASEDPYVTSFDAVVQSIDGHDMVLDRTFFYAEEPV